jgi:hypothetical protein
MISAMNISDLHGLGGPSNGENQKGGTKTPSFYLARAFVRQTLSFGDDTLQVDSGQNQFATRVGSRRLVLTVGNMSIIDVFDVNPNAHDSRTQFMNWALLTHGAFDFAADLRGYTWGAAVEYYHDAWAFRFGRFAVPKESNGMAIDFHLFSHYGDSLEVEHSYTALGKTGRVSVLGFRNYERMFAFRDATAVVEANGGYSDKIVDDVRRNQPKYGFGISLEQSLHRDVGVFLRGSWNDGKTETYSFSEIERSLALGASVRGALWHRASDASGVVWVMNGISQAHQDYLANGGLGFFIGDGRISYKPEELLEVYYSAQVMRGLWFALDYQLIVHPAYNADRGPAQFLGVRLHLEI